MPQFNEISWFMTILLVLLMTFSIISFFNYFFHYSYKNLNENRDKFFEIIT